MRLSDALTLALAAIGHELFIARVMSINVIVLVCQPRHCQTRVGHETRVVGRRRFSSGWNDAWLIEIEENVCASRRGGTE